MKGYRTLLINIGVAVVGVLQAADWTNILGSSETAGYAVLAVGIANMVLRALTSTPVGKAE